MNCQGTLQLTAGFTFINGLDNRIGSELGKDFPIGDLPPITLELIGDNEFVPLPEGEFTHHHAASGIRTPAPDNSVTVCLSVPPDDTQPGKLPVALVKNLYIIH